MGLRTRGERLASLGLIAAVGAALASPTTAPGATESTFCDRAIVAGVPWYPWEEPESDGRLGFGPSNVRMRVLPRLVASGGKVGYELFLDPDAKTAHPRWKVSSTMGTYHRGLHIARDEITRQVWAISPNRRARFFFAVPDKPASYVVTAVFTSPNGRQPYGYFRFYFKVIRPTSKARLALDADSYSSGQTVFGRVENHGTEPVSYGASYRIERYDGTAWSLAPESPRDFILPLYGASPGESGDGCSPFPIPSSMAPGHYRMTKEVGFGRLVRAEETTTLTAEFNVVP